MLTLRECEYHEYFIKPIVNRVRKKIENKDSDYLKKMVATYESSPWYKRFFKGLFEEDWIEYCIARDILLGKFKWEELDKREKENEEKVEKYKNESKKLEELLDKGRNIELFPGSLEEYERFKNAEYEIIDSGRRDKSVFYHPFRGDIMIELARIEVEAIIRYKPRAYDNGGVGLPCRIKKHSQSS